MVETSGHHRIQKVVPRSHPVEHALDLLAELGRFPRRLGPGVRIHPDASQSSEERKSASSLSFFGGRSRYEGMMSGPISTERMIAARGTRSAIWVSSGPIVPPFSPILWQARQPAPATISLPASYCGATSI